MIEVEEAEVEEAVHTHSMGTLCFMCISHVKV